MSSNPLWRTEINFDGAVAVVVKAQEILGSALAYSSATSRHTTPVRQVAGSGAAVNVLESSTRHSQQASIADAKQVARSTGLMGSRFQLPCTDAAEQADTGQGGQKGKALVSGVRCFADSGCDRSRSIGRASQAENLTECHGAATQVNVHLLVRGMGPTASQEAPTDCTHRHNVHRESAVSCESAFSWEPPDAATLKQRFLNAMPLQVRVAACFTFSLFETDTG
jgi:hypothetical protein